MRHFYVRLVLGILFLLCLGFSLVTGNLPFALLYLLLGGLFLGSAYALWRKDKRGDGHG